MFGHGLQIYGDEWQIRAFTSNQRRFLWLVSWVSIHSMRLRSSTRDHVFLLLYSCQGDFSPALRRGDGQSTASGLRLSKPMRSATKVVFFNYVHNVFFSTIFFWIFFDYTLFPPFFPAQNYYVMFLRTFCRVCVTSQAR